MGTTLITLGLLLLGLLILLGGADILVRGVSSLARSMGVPPVVIGLTVVAFGTSTPELVLATIAASGGDTALTFGNIVGANTVNIGIVLALTAIVRPILVETSIITREIPMMILGIGAMLVLSLDGFLGGHGVGSGGMLARGDGLMLLMLFGVFLYYTIMDALRRRSADPFVAEVTEQSATLKTRKRWHEALLIIGGLAGVAIGGRIAIDAAIELASHAGIPQHIISLTIVSWGTTLPELATGIMATRRGQGDIAIGNVVGSIIYNILCVGGIVATIHPIPLPHDASVDLLVMAAMGVALLPLSIRGPRMITRGEGMALLACYVGYMTMRLLMVRHGG